MMNVQRHFSLKFVLFVPALLSLIIFALALTNYYDTVNRYIDLEYARIDRALLRSTKAIAAIDYSFSAYRKGQQDLLLEHNRRVIDGVCQMWPIDSLLTGKEGKLNASPVKDLNYLLVGMPNICNPDDPLYQRANRQVEMAPMLSFLHDFDAYLFGVHYIDREGYVFSSPDTLARHISKALLETIEARSYWIEAAKSDPEIALSGPTISKVITKQIASLTIPFFYNQQYQGMISLDIDVPRLLRSNSPLASPIELVDTSEMIRFPSQAKRIHVLNYEDLKTHHALYYQVNWLSELQNFFVLEKYSLIVIGFIYLLSVIVLFYINSNIERSHFKGLAAKDPMTGLLNRRGLEDFWRNTLTQGDITLAVLDIDNFKAINDTYGHDVGDKVICYMAEKIEHNIRTSDAAARFGGEEFVIYLTCGNRENMHDIISRIKDQICEDSHHIIEGGFTVSGGVEVTSIDERSDFKTLFKAADEKLYIAKTNGKDQLVF
ncbi:diguanylate cyclase (GGDEF) domain-containing protein [Vibrio xiamenensis]|uniref:diguanylate cyclase n=1 Tax=Vibrio xiamenensis TaxID=861298 RepID=A0A1G7ZAR7_9VIBR|nr:diguanylate cyclase [Vibrio xiamenensis]SDH05852.1 diguanylate cyclase (GGDEF) domain-containing protein [Vibrio xiamenensis]